MSEPSRLRDESESALERALLDAGATYRGSRRARARTLAALGLAGSASLVAGAAGAASLSSSVAKLTWTKLLVAASLLSAGAVPAGYYVWHQRHLPPLPPARGTLYQSQAEGERSSTPTVVAAEPAAAPAQPEPRAAEHAATVHRARPEARTAMVSPALTKELTAVDAARSRLAEGQGERTLDLLDTYARAYPHGRLELEAEVLRIEALAQTGRAGSARARAEAFLRRHPGSVFAARVRRHLDD